MANFKRLFDRELDGLQMFQENVCDDAKSAELKALLDAGKELPSGYRQSKESNSVFIETNEQSGLTKDEIMSLVAIRQAKHIKTIKSCIVFLTALVAISLAVSILVGVVLPLIY